MTFYEIYYKNENKTSCKFMYAKNMTDYDLKDFIAEMKPYYKGVINAIKKDGTNAIIFIEKEYNIN